MIYDIDETHLSLSTALDLLTKLEDDRFACPCCKAPYEFEYTYGTVVEIDGKYVYKSNKMPRNKVHYKDCELKYFLKKHGRL